MTLPRQVLPGRFYLITRRCAQQQFLLCPQKQVNNAFSYCLAYAADHYKIQIVGTCALSNHHHTVIYDPDGNYPAFLARFHRLVAASLNTFYGRSDSFWSGDQVNVVHLEDLDAVLEYLTYTFVNPVRHRLVAAIAEWPGVNTYQALLDDCPIIATRPKFFFKDVGLNLMPERVELRMTVPDVIENRHAFIAALEDRVQQKLRELEAERLREGVGVMSRSKLRRQTWRDRPRELKRITKQSRNRARRTFAVDPLRVAEVAQRNQEFLDHYRAARGTWIGKWRGKPRDTFPPGSYWLGRFTTAPVPAPPPAPLRFA